MPAVIPCPHIDIADLAAAWAVSQNTVRRWFSEYGIKPVIRGRYKSSDIARYADAYGLPRLSRQENFELTQLKEENEVLKKRLAEANDKLLEIARLSAGNVQMILKGEN